MDKQGLSGARPEDRALVSDQAPSGLAAPRVDPSRVEYANKLSGMTDDELIKTTQTQVWLSAFAFNNPRAPAHWRCDLAHDEARRRAKPWLYQRGWNQAFESCGYTPSEQDRAAAIAIETRRAETSEAGSVEDESAGPQDIAQTQPPSPKDQSNG